MTPAHHTRQLLLGSTPSSPLFPVDAGAVVHPLLRTGAVQAREYQITLAARALEENLLLVLPTGLGKTLVAALATAETLRRRPDRRVVVLAPTRPLVLQHAETFDRVLAPGTARACTLTGRVAPPARQAEWSASRLVFTTPQGLLNDVEADRVDLGDVALLVVDEAHRAVGAYAYVALTRHLAERSPGARVLGLTASPGHSRARIAEIMEALGVEDVVSRTPEDPDVAPYVAGIDLEIVPVRLGDAIEGARDCLSRALDLRVATLQRMGFLTRAGEGAPGKRALLATGDAIRRRMGARPSGFLFGALHQQLVAIHALHAIELLETQGLAPLERYLERKAEAPSRSDRAFLNDPHVAQARARLSDLAAHPKEDALRALITGFRSEGGTRAIVFAQYRDTVERLAQILREAGLRVETLVGQAGEDGLDQDEQAARVKALARGDLDALVATSIGEEGLDIPSVDLVVFNEPVPSAIRAIQRRGRTGRGRIGRVVILVAEGTKDEAWLRSQGSKEEAMRRRIQEFQLERPCRSPRGGVGRISGRGTRGRCGPRR